MGRIFPDFINLTSEGRQNFLALLRAGFFAVVVAEEFPRNVDAA